MPNLLDLHLFLSKPIRPAPTEEELLLDNKGVIMSEIDQAIANGETIYGRFPKTVIDLVSDRVREIIDSSADLTLLLKTCANAYALYSQRKVEPSKESVKRAKRLPHEGLHPIFRNVLEGGELKALAFSERLKTFRLEQTILEAEGKAAKSKNVKGPSRQWLDVMKRKRAIHENIINLVHQQRSDNQVEKENQEEVESEVTPPRKKRKKESSGSKMKATSFKDEESFISLLPTNHHTEAGLSVKGNDNFGSSRLESAVLDLVADDTVGMTKQKSVFHSDKVKTESGARVKLEKTGIYKKWKERTHSKVSFKGEGDSEESPGRQRGDSWRGKKQQLYSIPNAHVRSEIKDLEQVRKERQRIA